MVLRGHGPYWTEARGALASYSYDWVSLPDDVRGANGLDTMLPDSNTHFLCDYEKHMLRPEEEVERVRTDQGSLRVKLIRLEVNPPEIMHVRSEGSRRSGWFRFHWRRAVSYAFSLSKRRMACNGLCWVAAQEPIIPGRASHRVGHW